MDQALKSYDFQSLIDYFLVVGLSNNAIANHLSDGSELSPEILSQFPPWSRPSFPFPESIEKYCAPFGLSLISGSDFLDRKLYSFILGTDSGMRVYCTCMMIFEPICQSDLALEGKLVPKILVIVSSKPFFKKFKSLLKAMYELSVNALDYPLELYIAQMLYQIPIPTKGNVRVLYQIHNTKVCFALPACNELPLLDINSGSLFKRLDLNNILYVFRHMSLEQSVVFLSSKENRLFTCSYSFISLLYPLEWSFIYVPLLPMHLMNYLDSPVNFVFGLHISKKEEILKLCSANVLVVDLDNNMLYKHPSKQIPHLPEHYGKKLERRMKNILKKSGAKPPEMRVYFENLDYLTICSIREYFFQFFVSILLPYPRFMNYESKDDNLFDRQGFLQTVPDNSKAYMEEFLHTQMFANFCQQRVYPRSMEQHSENLFFDESISAKENRSALKLTKTPTPFISDHSQNHSFSYIVPALTFSSAGRHYYPSFPVLDCSLLSQFPAFEWPLPCLEDILEAKIEKVDTKNSAECIYVCWFEIWRLYLWYQDNIEFPQRLAEVLNTLEEVLDFPHYILSYVSKMLLLATSKVNPSMAIPIYSMINAHGLLIDAATIQIMQTALSSLKKDGLIIKNNRNSLQLSSMPTINKPSGSYIRPRKYRSINFYLTETCHGCGTVLGEREIKQGWKDAQEFGCECAKCSEILHPKLHVQIDDVHSEDSLCVSPQMLLSLVTRIESGQDLELFKTFNGMIFWNLVYYFQKNNLPYWFFIPYAPRSADVFTQTDSAVEEDEQVTIPDDAD